MKHCFLRVLSNKLIEPISKYVSKSQTICRIHPFWDETAVYLVICFDIQALTIKSNNTRLRLSNLSETFPSRHFVWWKTFGLTSLNYCIKPLSFPVHRYSRFYISPKAVYLRNFLFSDK